MHSRLDRHCRGLVVLCLVNKTDVEHAIQHIAAPHARVCDTAHRVVTRRRRQHPGEGCGLGDADVFERLVEIHLRCCSNTIGTLPEEHLIKEQRHDLFLRELLFYTDRKRCFFELALQGPVERQEIVSCELLCQRTATALDTTRRNELVDGAQQSAVVDAWMHPKALVFGGDKGINNVLRHLVICNKYAATFTDLVDQESIAAEDPQRNLQRNVANSLGSRQ